MKFTQFFSPKTIYNLIIFLSFPFSSLHICAEDKVSIPTPEYSLKSMDIDERFEITTFAAEPNVGRPTAAFLDYKNRLWVAENYSYSKPHYQQNPVEKAPDSRDRILIFEDKDNDGIFDSRKIFTENVGYVFGIEYGLGGVWVASPPSLLFFPDKDADDIPDKEPSVVLNGWAKNDEHTVINSLTWGPDGWLYGNHGVFSDSKVGKPGTKESDRIRLNSGFWRFHPVTHEFEVFARGTGNPWGMVFDDLGNMLVSLSAMPHLWHISQGGYYKPMMPVEVSSPIFEGIPDIAEHSHRQITEKPASHAHVGLERYTGNNWPKEFKNALLMLNIGYRGMLYDFITPQKSSYSGVHGGSIFESNDGWFLGSSVKMGGSGEVYALDFNDYMLHGQSPEGKNTGRIYRVTQKGKKVLHAPRLLQFSLNQLRNAVLSEDSWLASRGIRILREKFLGGKLDTSTLKSLGNFFNKWSKNGEESGVRLRALWAAYLLGGITKEELQTNTTTSKHPEIRAWSIQLTLEDKKPSSSYLNSLVHLAKGEENPMVLRFLASALQRIPLEQRWELAKALLSDAKNGVDPHTSLLLWYGVMDLWEKNHGRFNQIIMGSKIAKVQELGERLMRESQNK